MPGPEQPPRAPAPKFSILDHRVAGCAGPYLLGPFDSGDLRAAAGGYWHVECMQGLDYARDLRSVATDALAAGRRAVLSQVTPKRLARVRGGA